MSLNLDARQRAMLQEMGITVWARPEVAAPAAPAAAAEAPVASTANAIHSPAVPVAAPVHRPPVAESAPPVRSDPPAVPVQAPRTTAASAAPPAPVTAAGASASPNAAPLLRLHVPVALYPQADPAKTPTALGAGWLIVTEGISASDPLAGDAGKLLDNMLRAMQLHLHPRVYLAALARPTPGMRAPEGEAPATTDVAGALEHAVHTLQPTMVLVLGHVAARAVLGRTEPLGRLRAAPHTVAGRHAVVTYDPAFLLRSQDAKAATWADLCRALALVRKG